MVFGVGAGYPPGVPPVLYSFSIDFCSTTMW